VLIADSLADYAAPSSPQADAPSLFNAWGGAGHTFQLYFDFSGYSDMAIGLSRMFGVRLPLNFNSPYKSRNITEFWRRWHMTPVALPARLPLHSPGRQPPRRFRRHFNLLTTMVLGGLWHGAGWNFVIWGALHGGFLVINHAWQDVCRRVPVHLPAGLGRCWGCPHLPVRGVCLGVFPRAGSPPPTAHRRHARPVRRQPARAHPVAPRPAQGRGR
jgi:D-alanyl-lipoteichoic acid acyltransferase DltB (MBOAT superfamily)